MAHGNSREPAGMLPPCSARRELAGIALLLAMTVGLAAAEPIARSLAPLDGRQVRLRECTLGNVVADAARAAAKADVALVQANLIREALIPAGDLEEETLRSALLYPDEQIVLVEIKGEKLRAALERSLSVLPQPSAAFLQVSGLQVTFRSQRLPGERVESVSVEGRALAPDQVYQAAVPLSLARGTLGYFRVFNAAGAGGAAPPHSGPDTKPTGRSLGQALSDHARTSKTISVTGGGRLQDLSGLRVRPRSPA